MKILGNIIRSFFRDDCLNIAANISFCAQLSIIPVAMMVVSIIGFFLGGSEYIFGQIVALTQDLFPVSRELLVSNLQAIMDQRSSLGLLGILFLIFISSMLMSSIERALDVIFKIEKGRNFLHSRLLGIAVIFLVTCLFFLPTMVQILEGAFNKYGFVFPLSGPWTGKIFFLLVAFVAYVMTVVIIPNKKVAIRYAAVGGVIFALGITVTKFIFKWYMFFSLQRYNLIYGSLTAAILLVVWIYYLVLLMLFATEVVAELQSRMLLHSKSKSHHATEDISE